MTGTVEHMNIDEVMQDSASDQSRLSNFHGTGSNTTYVAIVNQMDERFEAHCDEHEPRLSPPDPLFFQWLAKRNELIDEGVNEVTAHNRALETVQYKRRFRQYVENDVEAMSALTTLAQRVYDNEHIVLVCYCTEGKWCHRTVVTERLMSMLDESVDE